MNSKFFGLGPRDIARKMWWRAGLTPFTKAFTKLSLQEEGHMGQPSEVRGLFLQKIDSMVERGQKKQAYWWLYEAYKRARILSPRRAAPIAMRLAQLEGNPFDKLNPSLAKIMLTFAYGSVDMQLRFTRHLREKVSEAENKYGEAQKALDLWANDVLCKTMLETRDVKLIFSEELKTPMQGNPDGKYIITLDPLDGSSNIESKNIFGSILGVYENVPTKGREIKAAAIVVYGPVFSMVYSAGEGVHELEKDYGKYGFSQFEELHKNMKIPDTPKVYGVGGNHLDWKDEFVEYVDYLSQRLTLRYSGAFVADFMQILHRGGIFAYPNLKSAPQGKLRLLYECVPLSFIMEQAGGLSWDGRNGSILDAPIIDMDARVGLYIGNEELIRLIPGWKK